MRKLLVLAWITLCSGVARSSDLGFPSSRVDSGNRMNAFVGDGTGTCAGVEAFVGEGTGTCAGANAFVGDGTGTCAGAEAFVGDGTGTCAGAGALNLRPQLFNDALKTLEVRNLKEISNLMKRTRTEQERKMVIEKVLKIIDSGVK